MLLLPLAATGAERDYLLRWIGPPELDVAGYGVYLAFDSMSYAEGLDLGYVTADPNGIASFLLEGLDASLDYYAVMTTYDGAGNESVFSNQIVIPALLALCDAFGGDTDGDTLCDDHDPCASFANSLPLVISGSSGIPDECLCGDFDGDGRISATDAVFINACAAFRRSDCVSERDEVDGIIDGFLSSTDANLVRVVSAFIKPTYTLTCGRRPEGTCGGDTGVSCF